MSCPRTLCSFCPIWSLHKYLRMSSRYWCFTINNPSLADAEQLQQLWTNKYIQFLHCSLENASTTNTPHYQGYLELTRHKLRQTVKNFLPGQPHLEPRKGTALQALTYCLKDLSEETLENLKSSTYENSTLNCLPLLQLPPTITINTDTQTVNAILSNKKSKKLKKDDRLLLLKEAIDNNKTNKDLAELDFPIWVQYAKHLDHYRTLISKPRNHPVEVIVIYGPSGTGKSKYALENFPNAYWKQRSNWWDNYADHETVVFDEFYGWIPYDMLLRICDRYPLLVETKGGQVNFNAKTIVFTTNQIPERWYKNIYFKAFIRRVSKWIIMPAWGESTETDSYIEAYKLMSNEEF